MRLALTLTALLAATPVVPATGEPRTVHVSEGLDYLVPAGSPTTYASKGQYNVAYFKGRFKVSGTYHYGWLMNDPAANAADGDLDLYFIPDRDAADLLPYWAERGHVHEMRFRNNDAFVRAVISPALVDRIQKKEIISVTGRATILVESYQISVECDYPTYSVAFSSVVRPPTLFASRDVVDQYGC
jgi:hypothetical protein